MTVKVLFDDWIEPDVAEYYLACLLGIMPYEEDLNKYFLKVSGVFNTNNKVSRMLFNILEEMVRGEILEKRDDYEYRWNKSFKGYWEGGKAGLTIL